MQRRLQGGEQRPAGRSYCLGYPPHVVPEGETLCAVCGTLVAGFTLDTYQVQYLLGKGRSGTAYLTSHLRPQQQATLKVFPPDALTQPLWEDVRRELRLLGTFRQAGGILPVFRCGPWHLENSAEGSTYHSTSLLTLCQYTPWSLPQFLANAAKNMQPGSVLSWVTRLIEQVGMALNSVHEHGVSHGALVPGNILLSQERFWVADFALARLHPPQAPYLAPELEALVEQCVQQQSMAAFWKAKAPESDQYALAVLIERCFSSLLPSEQYTRIAPVLHQAKHANPVRRFTNMRLFIDEVLSRLHRPPSFSIGTSSAPSNGQPVPSLPSHQPLSSSTTRWPPESVNDWETLADRFFAEHRYEAALQAYQNILQLQPTDAAIWASLGDTYFALQEFEEAVRAYELSIKYNGLEPTVWFNRGTALDALGKHPDAQGI